MAIRFDKKLQNEINRTIKNFNQKITRLEKQERELLPNKITKKELLQNVYNRSELKRKLSQLQRFSKRGAEDIIETQGGIRTTRFEIENLKKESARIKRKISREITKYETKAPKVFGKTQDTTFAKMGDNDYLNKKARREALNKDILKLKKQEFENYKKLLSKSSRSYEKQKEMFKDNYINSLLDLGMYAGVEKSKVKLIYQKLSKLTSNNLIDLFNEDKSIKAIMSYYRLLRYELREHPEFIEEDIRMLFDNMYENIDEIIKDYT